MIMQSIEGLMSNISPLLWLILAIGLAVFESFTVVLVAIWFSIGALASISPAWLGAPYWAQWLIFISVSALLLYFTRPVVKKKLKFKNTQTIAD